MMVPSAKYKGTATGFLSLAGISKTFRGRTVLENISFGEDQFSKLAIMGETGSGKSTILKVIAGLEQPDAGVVLFNGKRVLGPDERLVPGEPGIAYLSQQFELPKSLRVNQVLEYANKLELANAKKIFKVCRIDHLLERRTNELSGGEKQRIAVARLLIGSPTLLLLDEPFSSLDRVHKKILTGVVKDINQKLSITCILVSHDPDDSLSWADHIIILKSGEIIQQGVPKEVYEHPVSEYAAGLLGNYTTLSGAIAAKLGLKKAKDKKVFIRPEQLHISKSTNKSLPGVITDIRYYGGHYELEVVALKQTLHIRSNRSNLKKGDEVHVTFGQQKASPD